MLCHYAQPYDQFLDVVRNIVSINVQRRCGRKLNAVLVVTVDEIGHSIAIEQPGYANKMHSGECIQGGRIRSRPLLSGLATTPGHSDTQNVSFRGSASDHLFGGLSHSLRAETVPLDQAGSWPTDC